MSAGRPDVAERAVGEAGGGAGDGATAGNGVLRLHGRAAGLEWALCSEPGEVRPHNEDYAGVSLPGPGDGTVALGPLFVVCDGLGGHSSGEVASRTAVDAAVGSWEAPRRGAAHQAARAAARAANLAVYDASLAPGRRGMATTLTALTLAGREAVVAHVGDSRAYLVRDGTCSQLTADHSRVGEMLRMGLISAEQAAVHPGRSQLTRTVGTEPTVQVDVVRTGTEPDDVFVLCSDGLWDVVSRQDVADAVTASVTAASPGGDGPVPGLAGRLVDLAIARQSPDNVTVVVVRVATDEPFPGVDERRSRFRWGRR